jgi:hypothetical protein
MIVIKTDVCNLKICISKISSYFSATLNKMDSSSIRRFEAAQTYPSARPVFTWVQP